LHLRFLDLKRGNELVAFEIHTEHGKITLRDVTRDQHILLAAERRFTRSCRQSAFPYWSHDHVYTCVEVRFETSIPRLTKHIMCFSRFGERFTVSAFAELCNVFNREKIKPEDLQYFKASDGTLRKGAGMPPADLARRPLRPANSRSCASVGAGLEAPGCPIGKTCSHVEIKVVDEQGQTVKRGEEREGLSGLRL